MSGAPAGGGEFPSDVEPLILDARYRPGFTHDKAMQIMVSERGRTFDPALLDVFCEDVAPKLAPSPQPSRAEMVVSLPIRFVRRRFGRDPSGRPVSASA